jgi:hypothetical protein
MSKKEKLLQGFKNLPKDFTFNEPIALLGCLGFTPTDKGKTSGSRIAFENADLNLRILAHKPHPEKVIKTYVIKQISEYLIENKLI